jgi:2-polyprenyl-3-methyl-5-hydroxy-6-metoxy-1,4-benzoquinol methylase
MSLPAVTKPLNKCVACDGTSLTPFLDLEMQPLVNNFHTGDGGGHEYQLGLNLCTNCWHTQIPVTVDPSLMFEDYIWVTGTTQTLRDYSKWFASHVANRSGNGNTSSTVLDIASNDGTQLDAFKELGWKTFGVDPAKNLESEVSARGHTIVVDFWPVDLGQKFDVITAQNVCAHTPDPLDFLLGVKQHLKENGLAFVQTSQSQMYQRNQFDTTYHEHVSFFSANSMRVLAERAGLSLTDIEIVPVHGDSYLFTLQHEGAVINPSVNNVLKAETIDGRYSVNFYHEFASRANKVMNDLAQVIVEYRHTGHWVVGYGAAAKGITVLNSRNMVLDWIVDDAPLKQNKFTPKTNIPVHDRNSLDIDDDLIIIPLAWNYFDEIKSKVEEVRKGRKTTYIKYFPELEVL